MNFPQDRLFLKLLVLWVFIWEWIQTGLLTQISFQIYVYRFGDFEALTNLWNSWFSVPVMSAIVACVVQCYFGWRIWVLSRSRIIFGVIIFVSRLSAYIFASLVLTPVLSLQSPRWPSVCAVVSL